MKQELITELRAFFKLDQQETLMSLEKNSKYNMINGLLPLIKSLNDPSISPKEIAQQVENVIVNIFIKREKATDLEKALKSVLEKFQQKLDNGDISFDDNFSTYRM
jgi:hypothetical protein